MVGEVMAELRPTHAFVGSRNLDSAGISTTAPTMFQTNMKASRMPRRGRRSASGRPRRTPQVEALGHEVALVEAVSAFVGERRVADL